MEDHHHGSHGEAVPARVLAIALALTASFMAFEACAGWWSGSLALLADAGHVFMDLFALSLSLLAATLAKLPATSTKTYGWHRAEILAALLNGSLLLVLSIVLLKEAWERYQTPVEILAIPMLIVACIGLFVNIIIAVRLHGHHKGDLNLTSAYLHVLGDAGASAGVVVGALLPSKPPQPPEEKVTPTGEPSISSEGAD